MALTVELFDGVSTFRPGDRVDGLVSWEFGEKPKWVEVRLYWRTAGKGDEDAVIVEVMKIDEPEAMDAKAFSFVAPDGPFSYRGQLIEIMWGIEAVAYGIKETANADMTLSSTGNAVVAANEDETS